MARRPNEATRKLGQGHATHIATDMTPRRRAGCSDAFVCMYTCAQYTSRVQTATTKLGRYDGTRSTWSNAAIPDHAPEGAASPTVAAHGRGCWCVFLLCELSLSCL